MRGAEQCRAHQPAGVLVGQPAEASEGRDRTAEDLQQQLEWGSYRDLFD
jgi:hypothetical protein